MFNLKFHIRVVSITLQGIHFASLEIITKNVNATDHHILNDRIFEEKRAYNWGTL